MGTVKTAETLEEIQALISEYRLLEEKKRDLELLHSDLVHIKDKGYTARTSTQEMRNLLSNSSELCELAKRVVKVGIKEQALQMDEIRSRIERR